MNIEFYTIGVYDSTEEEFFGNLISHGIDTFIDIRQRRGVRGAKYSFVNSQRLQAKLAEKGIKYLYIQELAPTHEIRELQALADKEAGELKRDRAELGETFKSAYKTKILDSFDFNKFMDNLEQSGATKAVFFCVEAKHRACHRSLVTDALKKNGIDNINHL
jgi:uncharacterized protein (DUF488 family)